jgi:hypothetical protein
MLLSVCHNLLGICHWDIDEQLAAQQSGAGHLLMRMHVCCT